MKVIDERGRKFFLAVLAVGGFVVVFASAYLAASVKALADLDLPIIAGAAAGIAGIAATYAGANAWAKQADAKIAEATGEAPGRVTVTVDPEV